MRRNLLAVALLLGVAANTRAGGGTEVMTPGWDGFPALGSGSVTWSIAPGSRTFSASYALSGAAANRDHVVGLHHFDVTAITVFGGGSTSTGVGFSTITREGNTSAVADTTFGILDVDGSGNAATGYTFNGVHPGVYATQFHVREGGAPGCPLTDCNAIYRSGGVFAGELARFAVPGAIAFWSGDGDREDEIGSNAIAMVGAVGYRAGHFRQGFDLDGTGHLEIANPAADGLAPASGFTVSMWVYQDTFSNTASVFNLRNLSNASGFTLEPAYNAPGSFLFAVNTDGTPSGFSLLTPSGFPFDRWFWIAATFDAATHTMRVYRDGELVAERNDVPGSVMSLTGSESLAIGHNLVYGANFDGGIDEVLFFDYALPATDLIALYTDHVFRDGLE
ncbi:MAG: LamG domain-containing protein [Xanthomonadales bacterium]|nr:LamG domain-containing protein [Xanthomonadales bacterium]